MGKIYNCIVWMFLLSFQLGVSQTQIRAKHFDVFPDASTIKNSKAAFEPVEAAINEGLRSGYYVIAFSNLEKHGIIQIPNWHIDTVVLQYKQGRVTELEGERFLSFEHTGLTELTLIIQLTKEAYIPINTYTYNEFQLKERKSFMFMGLYAGFALANLLLNLFYFYTLRDRTFMYYAGFILFISFGLLMSDGMLQLFGFSNAFVSQVQNWDHLLVVIFAALFSYNYLQMDNYYPKLKQYLIVLIGLLSLLCLIYFITVDFKFFIAVEILVFICLTLLWLSGVFIYHKNVFTKVYVIAYVFILILGIDYYVLKLVGLKALGITSFEIKWAGILEMVFLSYAVVYRVKILRNKNRKMRHSIESYLEEIESLNSELKKNEKGEENIFSRYELSFRESEILQLIATGKTNKEIAKQLHISVNTVKYHVKNVYEKLNIKSRKEAAAKFQIS